MNARDSEPEHTEGWLESTEGDLDPDLTEEAGYADWQPRERVIPRLVWQIVAAVLVVALIAPVILQAVR